MEQEERKALERRFEAVLAAGDYPRSAIHPNESTTGTTPSNRRLSSSTQSDGTAMSRHSSQTSISSINSFTTALTDMPSNEVEEPNAGSSKAIEDADEDWDEGDSGETARPPSEGWTFSHPDHGVVSAEDTSGRSGER